MVFGLLVATIGIATAPELPDATRAAIQAIVIGGLGIGMAYVFMRSRLTIEEGGVEVRNPFSTSRHPWSDIAGFRVGRHGLFRAACIIDLRDGRSDYVFAIQVPNRSLNRQDAKERRMVEELNAILEQHTRGDLEV